VCGCHRRLVFLADQLLPEPLDKDRVGEQVGHVVVVVENGRIGTILGAIVGQVDPEPRKKRAEKLGQQVPDCGENQSSVHL